MAHRVRPATLRSYRKVIHRHVLPALGSWPLADLRPGDVERWTGSLTERGLRPSTVALSRRVLVGCLTDAERDGRVPRNVARLARAPKVEGTTRRRALTRAEARALLDMAHDDHEAGLLVTLALGTGARVGELLALEWTDVDDCRHGFYHRLAFTLWCRSNQEPARRPHCLTATVRARGAES